MSGIAVDFFAEHDFDHCNILTIFVSLKEIPLVEKSHFDIDISSLHIQFGTSLPRVLGFEKAS